MSVQPHVLPDDALAERSRSARLPRFGVAAGLLVGGLGLAGGGYFPTTWGWSSLALLWGLALALAGGAGARPDRRAALWAGAVLATVIWIAVSALWSSSLGGSVLEVQRALVYAGGACALVVLARSSFVPQLLAGALGGAAVVACYALATRVFPERLGVFDPVAGYRLAGTVGYWNALGILCVLGLLLGLTAALRAESIRARASAAALLPVLAATLYFTFSRGAVAALLVGLAAALAVDRRRLQLALGWPALCLPAALCVWLASRADALTRTDSVLASASREGHRLALAVLVAGIASAALAVFIARVEARAELGPRVRRAGNVALVAAAVLAIAVPVAISGGPVGAWHRARHGFAAPPRAQVDLGRRLVSFSGNGRAGLWRAALDDASTHPILGSGAGSYERFWLAHRPVAMKVRDAHSLYLETLAELGPLGLALLLTALAVPLTALRLARTSAWTAGALAAYAAFLVHAAVDWDWEVTAVTVPALLCGGCLVLLARQDVRPPSLSLPGRCAGTAAALAAGAFALVGLLGWSALSSSASASRRGDFAAAASAARSAARFLPWSAEPMRALGEAQLAQGETDAAADSFRRAIARDRGDFGLWLDLARALDGSGQQTALDRAARLDPLSPELVQFRSELGLDAPASANFPEVQQ
jgi:hypothetical protein